MVLLAHPPVGEITGGLVPQFPGGLNSTLLLLIVAIVGTTVAPWQLFFQQSNVVDKRITPRWIGYARTDLRIGIVVVMFGGVDADGGIDVRLRRHRGLRQLHRRRRSRDGSV